MATNLSREEKLALRRAKLQEIKRQKDLQGRSEPAAEPQLTFAIKTIKNTQLVNQKKRKGYVFDEENLNDGIKKFIPPKGSSNTRHESVTGDEVDELDKFVSTLTQTTTPEFNNVVPEHDIFDEDLEEVEEDSLLTSKLAKLNQEKILIAPPPSTTYGAVRKCFYNEPADIDDAEMDLIRHLWGVVDVEGDTPPKPVTSWQEMQMPSNLMATIAEYGYDKPSPIQAQAIPALLMGRDLVGIAKTGSGKTLAFLLPLLRHVQGQPQLESGDGPVALVLTPTRELALQIYKEVTKFLGFSAVCCYGGISIETQIADLKRGVEIIVGTPGRVIDLLAANGGRVTNLHRCSYVVMDEADRMFDMGFEPQVTKILSQVTRPDHQTVLFSATFPKKMATLARRVMVHKPLKITIGEISTVASEIHQEVKLFNSADSSNVHDAKFDYLVEILADFFRHNHGKVLIFVELQSMADTLLVGLLRERFSALTIHGGKDQIDRKHAIKIFSDNDSDVNVLIATSIAARGLDVKNLNLVINYDPASHLEDYVHRVGRTGRAGAKGRAITFVTSNQERAIADLARAFKASGQNLPSELDVANRKFLKLVKEGKAKFSYGFGGKGLENLDENRQLEKTIQHKLFDGDTAVEKPSVTAISKPDIPLPSFEIFEGCAPETGHSSSKYHSRIVINDLPQLARWHIAHRESLAKIVDASHASVTHKGQFYASQKTAPTWPPVEFGRDVKPAPKLYLLIEGATEHIVKHANNLIRERMLEGLDLAAYEEKRNPSKKYSV